MQTSEDSARAIALLIRATVLAHSAGVLDRLEAGAHARLEAFAALTNFDNDACAFVTSASRAEV
jgi:hypothetical protein